MSGKLALKVARIQDELGTLQKTSENPFFKSTYIEINELLRLLKPLAKKENILISNPLDSVGDASAVGTLIVDLDSGENFYTKVALPPAKNAQDAGGGITYFRRYALISFLGLDQEDDDGNAASNSKPKAKAKKIGAKAAPKSNSRATF
jgi:hypothetical protein